MKRAIISFAHGRQHRKYAAATWPTHRVYAERCRAKFVAFHKRTVPRNWPVYFQKYRMAREALRRYDRVMLLDADCVVMPSCPDLFGLVTPGMFGGFDEVAYWGPTWASVALFELAVCRDNIDMNAWNGAHLNAGVWVFDRRHFDLFSDPEPGPFRWRFPEQTMMSWRLSRDKTPIVRLPESCNYMSHYKNHPVPSPHRVDIYHVVGWNPPKGDRLGTLRRLAKKAMKGWEKC